MEEIQVKIKMTSNAQVYTIKIAKSDTILKLKEECEKQTQIPPSSQNLVYKGRILVNEKLVSDYNIDNDHTIILVKKQSAPPQTQSKPAESTNTSNAQPNNTNQTSNNNTNNNAGNNNANPFLGMGGGMPDFSQLGTMMGNIDPNEINNMMQNMGGLGGLGNLGGLGGLGGMNPQMISQMLNNPMYMQMMNNVLQNPEMIQMALNNPQIRQLAQSNPQLQAILDNPQLMQQIFNPQTLQLMSNLFTGMGTGTNNQNNPNPNSTGTSNTQNPFGMDLGQLTQMLQGMGGLGGLGGIGNNMGTNSMGNAQTEVNDANVDYKEKYKDQLAQLKDMGFINEEANIQVLKQCSGNVQFAIERLLNMLG
jgi:ubiquilin